MVKNHAIGIDLGATYVRAALSDAQGHFLTKLKEETSRKSANAVSEQLIKMSRLLCKKAGVDMTDIRGMCIASAGPLDLEGGGITAPNFRFKYVPLVKPIQAELKIPVYLINDCNASAVGEHEFGAGKGVDDLVYITLSTGIGGGAYVDGKLLLGKDGNAVEVGHTTIDFTGAMKCGCGKRGHWEAYCSGRNIPEFVGMKLKGMDKKRVEKSLLHKLTKGNLSKLSAETIFKAAKSGDVLSKQLVDEVGRLNTIGLANVVSMFDPSLITVGGSVALKNRDLILKPIARHMKYYSFNRPPKIMITPLGEDIGLYGAAAVVFRPPEALKRKGRPSA